MKIIENKEYITFINGIKSKIKQAQYLTYKAVNEKLVNLYWELGKSIFKKQRESGWGKGIIPRLASDLQREFPQNSGFSERNLKYMRRFYIEYKDKPKVQPLVAQIPWSHNLIILDKIKNDYEKEYYCKMVMKHGWSKRILEHQIETKSFERFLSDKKSHNFNETLSVRSFNEVEPIIKDTYMLDFLGISENIKERELENKILANLKTFLLELGIGFTFVGSQYKIVLGENEYFIDLLFYHRNLRCLVAIDLKMNKFIPEYAGKMNFYLNLLDDKVKNPNENPSIGLILCKDKDHFVVEYVLRNINKPVGVAKYYLTNKLPPQLLKQLPSSSFIEKKLKKLGD